MENSDKNNVIKTTTKDEDDLKAKKQAMLHSQAEYLAAKELVSEKQKEVSALAQLADKFDAKIDEIVAQRDGLNAQIRGQRKEIRDTEKYLISLKDKWTRYESWVNFVRKNVEKARREAKPTFNALEKAEDELLKSEQTLKVAFENLKSAQGEYVQAGGNISSNKSVIGTLQQPQMEKTNPWISGSFYIVAFLIVMAALAVITINLPWYSVVIVIIGGLLAISIIGAFQLRNDKNLSEENFIKLMITALKQLPLLKKV